ncbi:MAG: porin [Burkholderiaceae bacterium]
MKKTQFALAALALVASSAALAEGVTVYGTADVSVVHTDNGTFLGGAGNSAGSLIGFKGTEDLGGGLKASFNLETGYTGNNGSLANGGASDQTTVLFNRAANVGISNGMLGVTLGTQISPFIAGELVGATAVGGNGVFVPGLFLVNGGTLAGTTQSIGGFFIPDAVSISANVGGVSVNGLTRALGSSTSEKYSAINAVASFGAINASISYQDVNSESAVGSNTVVAANTTIGDVRINGAYGSNKGAFDSTGYMVGASMPLIGAISGGLTYARNASLYSMTSVSAQYTFSKSTFAYATYSHFSDTAAVAANDNTGGSTKSLLTVGLAKSF